MFFESHIRLNHWIVTKTRTCYFTETYNVYISKQFIVIKVEFTYSYLFPLIIILANDQSPSTFTCTVLSYNLYKRPLYFILFYLFFLCIFSAAYDDPTSSNQGLMEKVRGKFLNYKLLCRYMIHELVLSLDFIIERFINGVLLIYVGSNRLGVGNQWKKIESCWNFTVN